MLARIRKAMDEREEGFTLIELLVVMIIIGILAAIAIPVFLNQRAKARDTSTKADVSTVGKEIATYFVDGTGTLTPTFTTGQVVLADAGTYTTTIKLSSGTVAAGTGTTGGWTGLGSSTNWCIALVNSAANSKPYSYSAANGLQQATC